jgi:hypothetical protein
MMLGELIDLVSGIAMGEQGYKAKDVPCRGSGAGGRTLAHKQRLAAVGRSQVPPTRLTHPLSVLPIRCAQGVESPIG